MTSDAILGEVAFAIQQHFGVKAEAIHYQAANGPEFDVLSVHFRFKDNDYKLTLNRIVVTGRNGEEGT